MKLSRRMFAATASSLVTAGAVHAIDPTDERAIRNAYRKLRYRMGNGVVFWWMDGVKYAQQDA